MLRRLSAIQSTQCLAAARRDPHFRVKKLRNHTTSSSNNGEDAVDDYYALLLADPAPNAAQVTLDASTSPEHRTQSSQSPQILFSTPASGPSARVRGLSRGEEGLSKPPEPDNCCMSGCVNCVWDTYREEMEQWVQGQRNREARLHKITKSNKSLPPSSENTLSEEDGIGSLRVYAEPGKDVDDEMFRSVPVGIREFMKQEKRLREKKEREKRQAS